jgi:hypothetical protein
MRRIILSSVACGHRHVEHVDLQLNRRPNPKTTTVTSNNRNLLLPHSGFFPSFSDSARYVLRHIVVKDVIHITVFVFIVPVSFFVSLQFCFFRCFDFA